MSRADLVMITTDGVTPREMGLDELVWLWRTAQLPAQTEFLDENGEWQPVDRLVDPIVAKERRAPAVEAAKTKPDEDWSPKFIIIAVLIFLICVAVKVIYTIFSSS